MNTAELERFAEAMRARRAHLRMRMGLAVAFVVLFGSLAGWWFSVGWLAVYAGLQYLEHLALPRTGAMTDGRARITMALLVLSGLSFGFLAMTGPFNDGPWGVGAANLLLAGAILNTVTTNMSSRTAFFAAVAPFAFYMATLPIVAFLIGGGFRQIFLQAAAGGLIVFSGVMIWRAAFRVHQAEMEARAESERRRAEAESAVAAKSAFIAVVSHELRTPISAIIAGAAELERGEDATTRSNGRLIADAGAMMRTLLNDLLDRAKLDAGRLSVEMIDFDLRSLLVDQVRFWRAEARKKGLRLQFRGSRFTPQVVNGDPTRIRQILNNLLSNALKFTETGSVTVHVARDTGPDDAHAITLSVTDTGPGMTEEQLSRLFKPFEQAEASTARQYGGTGLGMAISRDLARLLGGDLTAKSAPGQGARFELKLDLAPGELAVQAPAASEAGKSMGVAVLVVDDHEINRRAMTMILEPAGAQVTCVSSALEALDVLGARTFDVVLMDCNMPGMDGRAAARELRSSHGPNRDTPVIAVTGAVEEQDVSECHAAGMNDLVAKPIDAAELYAALDRVLAAGQGRSARASSAA